MQPAAARSRCRIACQRVLQRVAAHAFQQAEEQKCSRAVKCLCFTEIGSGGSARSRAPAFALELIHSSYWRSARRLVLARSDADAIVDARLRSALKRRGSGPHAELAQLAGQLAVRFLDRWTETATIFQTLPPAPAGTRCRSQGPLRREAATRRCLVVGDATHLEHGKLWFE